MKTYPLYDQNKEVMRVAGFISGGGSNLVKIIEHARKIESLGKKVPYEVAVIFSENLNSGAENIGKNFGIPVVIRNMEAFYREREKPRRDMNVRREFDSETVKALKPFDIDIIAYAGYMSIATKPLIESHLGVNVHPADLSITKNGKRKYIGAHAVKDAILAGEKEIKSTTHIVEEEVDYGRILMISRPVNINPDLDFDENQERLKESGDWEIFPRTLEYLANGRYSQDELGSLYFDGKLIPFGIQL